MWSRHQVWITRLCYLTVETLKKIFFRPCCHTLSHAIVILSHTISCDSVILVWNSFQTKITLYHGNKVKSHEIKGRPDTPDAYYVTFVNFLHILLIFVYWRLYYQWDVSREYCVCEVDFKMVALCLAQEERLSEIVKQFTCLYDKTTVGYRE